MNKYLLGIPAAVALFGVYLPAFASEATSDGFPPSRNLNYTHAPGVDQAIDGTAATTSGNRYLFIAGSVFTPRKSSQSVTYPGGGCIYSSEAVTTSLELPKNAQVLGVRLFYRNVSESTKVSAYLTSYTGDGLLSDAMNEDSTFDTGYASDYFAFTTPLIIDNYNQGYTLTGATDVNTELCGMRVLYLL